MDVSEMCIDKPDVKEESITSTSKRPLQAEYQQQYLLQHRYLKTYLEDSNNDDVDSMSNLMISSTNENNDKLLKQIIEKCNLVYQQIGKYRTDPLRESERNQIIDEVFFTAEDMLKDLEKLKSPDSEQLQIEPSINSTESTSEKYKMIRQARNLQKSSQAKYKRRSRNNMVGHRCHSCNTTDTPEWRRGPDGARTLCNACGLHYSKLLKKGSLTIQTHNYMHSPPPLPEHDTNVIEWK